MSALDKAKGLRAESSVSTHTKGHEGGCSVPEQCLPWRVVVLCQSSFSLLLDAVICQESFSGAPAESLSYTVQT